MPEIVAVPVRRPRERFLIDCQFQRTSRGPTWRCAACRNGRLGFAPKKGTKCPFCTARVAEVRAY